LSSFSIFICAGVRCVVCEIGNVWGLSIRQKRDSGCILKYLAHMSSDILVSTFQTHQNHSSELEGKSAQPESLNFKMSVPKYSLKMNERPIKLLFMKKKGAKLIILEFQNVVTKSPNELPQCNAMKSVICEDLDCLVSGI
jgi:hypothetical protein